MADPYHSAVGTQQQVTSSDLVRRFGVWQERAARAPVYIIHRGRPRFALVSLDIMDALCAAAPDHDREADDQALADTSPAPLLLVGADGRLRYANVVARASYGAVLAPGVSPAAVSRVSGTFLADAVARVLSTGSAESVEIVPDRFPDRRLEAIVSPLPSGCAVRLDDLTARDDLVEGRLARQAIVQAIGATRAAAVARIGARGVVIAPDADLAALTGATPEQLAVARFVSLLAVADRPLAGERIEAVFATGEATSFPAALLARGAQALPVTIGISPVRLAGRVEELIAAIVPSRP